MMKRSDFNPAWWLSNAHAQTMYPTLTRRLSAPIDHRERFELPDGDFLDLAWAVNGLDAAAPLVVFLHGLGGSELSSYVAGQLRAYNRSGWRAVFMHFRGASHEPNRLARAYHSGETHDLDCVLKALAAREPSTKKAVVGVSLGGNVLLKWLGEQGPQSFINAAVAVSVPFQLRLVADRINQGFSRLYQAYLLNRMRAMFARKCTKYPELLSKYGPGLKAASCFWTFDEQVTAPLYGFPNVHAYYRESSSYQYLTHIATPTLIIHALDDPFMTPDALPKADDLSDNITLEFSEKGGHVGFIEGRFPGRPIYWLDRRIPTFLRAQLG